MRPTAYVSLSFSPAIGWPSPSLLRDILREAVNEEAVYAAFHLPFYIVLLPFTPFICLDSCSA